MKRRMTILLVGDDATTAGFVRDQLRKVEVMVFDCRIVPTLSEAATLVDASRAGRELGRHGEEIDAVLIDLDVEGSKGLGAFEAIRDHAVDLAIVLMTGFFDWRTGWDAIGLGAQDYVVKGRFAGESLARTLVAAVERKRLERTRNEMLAAIGHEFRSRTFSILAYAAMMVDPGFRPDDDGWRTEFGSAVQQAAEGIVARIDEIHELTQLSHGALELKTEDFPIAHVIADVDPIVGAWASDGNVKLVWDVPRDLPPAQADAARTRQILLNLVSNAIKLSPPGETVTVAVKGGPYSLEISVSDHGPGFAEEDALYIFEPFHRMAETIDAVSGVSLALTKRLVEAQKGRIWLRTEPGRGATFTVALPVGGKPPRPERRASPPR